MKIYTIATKTNEYYGNGNFRDELRICQEDGYIGGFPPVFCSPDRAKAHLDALPDAHNKRVVELALIN
jgi:hypothetical protein